MAIHSAIYLGNLRHRRFRPREHRFTYPLFMVFLDVDRIPELMRVSPFSGCNGWSWASFDDRDHFGDPALPLRQRLRQDAAANAIDLPDGRIFLLTHLRYLGYSFNPVSFFYCYDARERLQVVLAEVNNTFGEMHNYWLSPANQRRPANSLQYRCRKLMHVSPFMQMELDYDFVLTEPGERLVVHMRTLDSGGSLFDATLNMTRRDWTAGNLHRALLRHPLMTVKVIGAIHWQALLLFLKRVPVYTHPARRHHGDSHG